MRNQIGITRVLLALIAGTLSVGTSALAQTPPVTPPATSDPPAVTAAPDVPIYGDPTDADKALLKRMLAQFQGKQGFHTVSELTLIVNAQGLAVTMKDNLHIISKAPHKFRSNVSLQLPGGKMPVHYLIVSDGARQFIYRPGIQRYSVESLKKKDSGDNDFFSTGLLYGFLIDNDTSEGNIADIDLMQKAGGKTLTATEKVGEKEFRIFQITLPQNSGEIKLFVDPASGQLDRIGLKHTDGDTALDALEKIVQVTPATDFAPGTFTFAPPKGTKKIGKIDISDSN